MAYFCSLVVVNSCGLIINVLAVFMFLKFRRELLSSNNNKLLLSLAIGDLLVSVFGIAGATLFYSAINGKITRNNWKFAGILPFFGSFFISIMSLVVMSCDRLISVVYALQYKTIMTEFRTNLLIVLTWFIPIFILIMQGAFFLSISPGLELKVRSYLLTTFFVAGAVTLIIVNGKLYFVIQRKCHQITVQCRCYAIPNSIDLQHVRERITCLKLQKKNFSNSLICIWMTAIFIMCWLPITVYYTLRRNGFPPSRSCITFVTCLASINSFLNPLIYLMKRKLFRKRFARCR